MAAEIQVLSAGALQPGLIAAVEVFRKQSGHDVKVTYATAPQLRERVGRGEVADIVIAPSAVIGDLVKGGKVAAEGQVSLGRVGAGVVVRNGAPLPDISSADALKRSLLDADSVVFNRASSGIYIERMLKKLEVFDRIQAKITRYPDGTAVMHHLMKGRGKEFGFGGITDILIYREKGLTLVGPLPAKVQNYTTYVAVPMSTVPNAEVARAFVRYLGSSGGKALFVAAGIE